MHTRHMFLLFWCNSRSKDLALPYEVLNNQEMWWRSSLQRKTHLSSPSCLFSLLTLLLGSTAWISKPSSASATHYCYQRLGMGEGGMSSSLQPWLLKELLMTMMLRLVSRVKEAYADDPGGKQTIMFRTFDSAVPSQLHELLKFLWVSQIDISSLMGATGLAIFPFMLLTSFFRLLGYAIRMLSSLSSSNSSRVRLAI